MLGLESFCSGTQFVWKSKICYLLLVVCYLLLVICYWLFVIGYLLWAVGSGQRLRLSANQSPITNHYSSNCCTADTSTAVTSIVPGGVNLLK